MSEGRKPGIEYVPYRPEPVPDVIDQYEKDLASKIKLDVEWRPKKKPGKSADPGSRTAKRIF